MKNILIIVCVTISSLCTNSLFASNLTDWQTYFENDTIKIEFNYLACDFSSTASQEIIVLRFTNLINKTITINYNTEIWHNDKKVSNEQNLDEFRKEIKLINNQVITIDCENKWKEYTIFSGFIHNETYEKYISLTKFELTNISINNE